jgi:ABC-type branched-subunit amino acid transport system substrate-binding protein
MQSGVRLAIRDVNLAGGILGRQLVAVHRDSGSLPTVGVDAAMKLVKVDKVIYVIGGFSSGVTTAMAEAATIPNNITHCGQGCTSPMLSVLKDDDYFYRTCMQDLYQGAALAEMMWRDGARKITIPYANNPYGLGIADTIAVAFKELGGTVLAKIPHELGKPSYKAEISMIFGPEPDAVAMIEYPEDMMVISKQSIAAGYGPDKIPWYGCDAWAVPEVLKSVGAEQLEGVKGTAQGVLEGVSYKYFLREYEAEFGSLPQKPFIEPGYDAVVAFAVAVARSGKLPEDITSKDVRDNLRLASNAPGNKFYAGPDEIKKGLEWAAQGIDTDYVGVASEVDFDEYGDIVAAVRVWQVKGGEIVSVANIVPEPVKREKLGPRYLP